MNNILVNENDKLSDLFKRRLQLIAFILLGLSLAFRLTELSFVFSRLFQLNKYILTILLDSLPAFACMLLTISLASLEKIKRCWEGNKIYLFYKLVYGVFLSSYIVTGVTVSIGRLYYIILFSITIIPIILLANDKFTIENLYDSFSRGFIIIGYVVWILSWFLQPFLISGYTGIFANRNAFGEFNALIFGLFLYRIIRTYDTSHTPSYKIKSYGLFFGLSFSSLMVVLSLSRTSFLMISIQIASFIFFIIRNYSKWYLLFKKFFMMYIVSFLIAFVMIIGVLNHVAYPLFQSESIVHNKYKSYQKLLQQELVRESSEDGLPKLGYTPGSDVVKLSPQLLLSRYFKRFFVYDPVSSYTGIKKEEFLIENESIIDHEVEKGGLSEGLGNEEIEEDSILYKILTNSKIVNITTKRSLIWYSFGKEVRILGHRKTYLHIPRYVRDFSGTAHNVVIQVAFDGGLFAGIAMLLLILSSVSAGIKEAFYRSNNKDLERRFFVVVFTMTFVISSLFGSEYSPFSSGIPLAYYFTLMGVIKPLINVS